MKKAIILTSLTCSFFSLALQGQFNDPFSTGANAAAGEYLVGTSNLAGQAPVVSGWTGAWTAATGDGSVLSTGLSYTGLSTSGGAIVTQSNARFGRTLATGYDGSTNGTVYMSVLLQVQDNTSQYRALEIHNGGIGDSFRRMQISVSEAGTSDYTFRMFNNNAFLANLGASDNLANLFVIKIDFSNVAASDAVSIWRNPENLTSEALSTVDGSFSGFDLSFDTTSLARFGSGGGIVMDELRFGNSWAEVVNVVPEPSAYALVFSLASLGFILIRRRRSVS